MKKTIWTCDFCGKEEETGIDFLEVFVGSLDPYKTDEPLEFGMDSGKHACPDCAPKLEVKLKKDEG